MDVSNYRPCVSLPFNVKSLKMSCLSNLLAFEEAVTRMMDEGHTVFLIYLDFAKAFDSVSH